jgi:tungstate transport system ATP-binding protein
MRSESGNRTVRDTPSDLPIRLEAVSVRAGAVGILHDITLEIAGGAPTVLLGPNGSGKSTLIKLGMCLIPPSSGRITFGGRSSARVTRSAIVFQKPVMLRRTAAANIAFALSAAGRAPNATTISHLLTQVGLAALADRPARRLSGGEQQRLALARALARAPEVLFLDEPTASLDPAATKGVEDIIARTASAGVKIVMATHDLGQARRLAGDIVFLAGGCIVEQGTSPQFFTSPSTDKARRFLAGDLVL